LKKKQIIFKIINFYKNLKPLFFALVFLCLFGVEVDADGIEHNDPLSGLTVCEEKDLGVKILCGAKWTTTKQFQKIVFEIRIEEEGGVTATIEKSRESGLFWEDLTPSALQYVYDYADHFKYTQLMLGLQKAVCIIGHPRSNSDTQLLDYFLLKEKNLYRVSFAVTPQTDFQEYEPLFENMIVSFEFLSDTAPEHLLDEESTKLDKWSKQE
jgi:hypothetical protein